MPGLLFACLSALGLAGCSVLDMVGSTPSAQASAGALPPYRRLVAREIKTILGDPAKAGLMQISAPHVVAAIKGASWLTCVKTDIYAQPHYYAVFIQGEKIVDSRVAVVLDRCEQEEFTAFEWLDESKKSGN